MKVLFIANGLTHYYNLVLSRLNSEAGIEVVVIAPGGRGADIGEGVYQTKDGINFKVIRLNETQRFGFCTTFEGLGGVIRQERPTVVIVFENYLMSFLVDLSVVMAMKHIRAGLILKSIPFRLLAYQEACNEVSAGFARLPILMNRILIATGLIKLARRLWLEINKRAFCLPDAHVNYVEAHELWASYGVAREKIFVTRNSPDTDLLFGVKNALENVPQILPRNPYRLLHVGRLVKWKRVDMLMRAFSRVRERWPKAELLVIGTGPEEASLKKLGDDLNLGTSVTFTGGVYDPRMLGQYYMASSLYVLAGMGGLSINEAMCFGLPVLCSVCDGTEKVLVREGVNGRYFRDGDEEDLHEKIIWCFEHAGELQQMGLKSLEIIRNEVNIRTVLDGYIRAFHYVQRQQA
ncbi:MAG: glycosyltransferase family 4 protein [Nitrospira sp.]|nr:MAG: glycosyltransferase family 4 protein [Nitrospira sp.]